MCKECQDLIDKYYPQLTDDDKSEVLFSATCFPFCGPELLEDQLEVLKNETDGTLKGALLFASEQLKLTMKDMNKL